MKKKIVLVLFLLLFFIVPTTVKADDGYVIRSFNSEIIANENGVLQIRETIDVEFLTLRRGIYRILPLNYDFKKDLGKEFYFPITDLKVIGHEYEVEKGFDTVSVRIGDADNYANQFETYVIEYNIHLKPLGYLENNDLLYLNVISGSMGTTIDKGIFSISFPKDIDLSKTEVYYGTYGEKNYLEDNACSYDNTTFTLKCSIDNLEYNSGVTLYQPLEMDYFAYQNSNNSAAIIGIVVMALSMLLTIYLYIRYGRDEKVYKVIEFTAPAGMSSLDVGYIYDNAASDDDVVSLIIEWGKNNYLTIEEIDGDLTLHKVRDLPENTLSHEKRMFNSLFKKEDSVQLKELKEKFYSIVTTTKSGVKRRFSQEKYRLFDVKSKGYQIILCILMFIVNIVTSIVIAVRLQNSYLVLPVLIASILVLVVSIIYVSIKSLVNKRDISASSNIGKGILLGIVNIIPALIYLLMNKYYEIDMLFVLIMIAIRFISGYTIYFVDRRTSYGAKVYGQVLGLEEFIRITHKEQLEMLAKDNPNIFYDILPYAYAFGLTDVWNNHFKDMVVPPATFYTNPTMTTFNHYYLARSLSRTMTSTTQSLKQLAASESMKNVGKGGFSGGGGSFGGGGGFSGGGVGGGGGGSW